MYLGRSTSMKIHLTYVFQTFQGRLLVGPGIRTRTRDQGQWRRHWDIKAQKRTIYLCLCFIFAALCLVFAVALHCDGLAPVQVGDHTEWGLGQALWSHNMYECSLCRILFARSPPALAVSAIMLPFGKATRSCAR